MKLLGGYQNDTHTVLRFSRPWNTCDEGQDYILSVSFFFFFLSGSCTVSFRPKNFSLLVQLREFTFLRFLWDVKQVIKVRIDFRVFALRQTVKCSLRV